MKENIVDNVPEVPYAIILNDKVGKENSIFTDFAEYTASEVVKKKRIEDKFPIINKLCRDNIIGVAIYKAEDLKIIDANNKCAVFFKKLYGITGNFIGYRKKDIIPDWYNSAEYAIWKSIINKNKTYSNKEYKYVNFKGEVSYWDVTIIPYLENGRVTYVIEIIKDVTEAVIQSKNLKSVLKMQEQFFSFIAHEFRTPLTVIYSALQAMEVICKDELTDKSRNYINKIRKSSLQQLRLVNNLLDITRADAGYLKIHTSYVDIVHITESIVDSVSVYAEQKNIRLNFYSNINSKFMLLDDEKYERILLNLLSNAIKFTPENKHIDIRLHQIHKEISMEIEDWGVGIPEDKLDIIFDRFKQVDNSLTRKGEGSGIGLSLVKLLVEAMEGDIRVKSNIGEGTTFTIKLPIKEGCKQPQLGLIQEALSDRLNQSMNIEFSNIYFT